jgi:hypothetical protein
MGAAFKLTKMVEYKSTMCINLRSAAMVDCRVKVGDIFAKAVGDGDVIVYGEYKMFFVFSFVDGHKNKGYLLKTQKKNFSEYITCEENSIKDAKEEIKPVFTPEISYVKIRDGVWNITVRGQFELLPDEIVEAVHIEQPEKRNEQPQIDSFGTTIIRLGDSEIEPSSLLEMDNNSIQQFFSDKNDSDTH